MMRNLILAVAMFSLMVLAACSASLGDTPTDLLGEGVSAPVSCANPDDLRMVEQCAFTPYVNLVTAIGAFEDLKAVADAALGVESVWVGSVRGAGIGRDGKSVGTGLSGWTTAWFTGPVEDPDMLVFDTTGGVCRVQNRCACATNGSCLDFDSINMSLATRPTVIAQDSDAAILAAFPTDPEDQKYDMFWNGVIGQWTVTRVGAVVDVDVVEPDVTSADVVVFKVQNPDLEVEIAE